MRLQIHLQWKKISLIRLFFYIDGAFSVSPTARAESLQMAPGERRDLHDSFLNSLFQSVILDGQSQQVEVRANQFAEYHRGERNREDCCIAAECEIGNLTYLVSYDKKLRSNLKGKTRLEIITPSELWLAQGISPGDSPAKKPHSSNPLSKEYWWRYE